MAWLKLQTIANNILWMKCTLSFKQRSARRELVIVVNSFISSENRNEIVVGKGKMPVVAKWLLVVSRMRNAECEMKDFFSGNEGR